MSELRKKDRKKDRRCCMEERKGKFMVNRTRRKQGVRFTVRRKKSVTKEAKESITHQKRERGN